MKPLNSVIVLLLGTLLCVLAVAPGPGTSRTQRDATGQDLQKYLHAGIWCLSCSAGMYVKQHCSEENTKGLCEPCEFDAYTEHDNGLTRCLQCTKCRSDQDTVERCTSTRNTQCQCKQGLYCLPDQACEVCKTCSKCRNNEEVEKNCTASSNTFCRRRSSTSASSTAAVVVTVVLISMLLVVIVSVLYCKTSARCRRAVVSWCSRGFWKTCVQGVSRESVVVRQNGLNATRDSHIQIQSFLVQTPGNLVGDQTPAWVEAVEEEEDTGLGKSLPNTATSSQSSLSVCSQLRPCQPCPAQPHPSHCGLPPSPTHPWQLIALENEKLRRLIPLNGEESLKKSFDLFGELDILYHNRFFRYIGLSDNAIRSAEMSSVEDKVYELLKTWLEKEGLKADFNSLIEALLYLDQRLSAENIIVRAISNGYFKYEDD